MNTVTPTYDLPFFRRLFENTTEEQWCCNQRTSATGQHCAMGFAEAVDGHGDWGPCVTGLVAVFAPLGKRDECFNRAVMVNDLLMRNRYPQPTPRARILAAITDLERMAAAPQS